MVLYTPPFPGRILQRLRIESDVDYCESWYVERPGLSIRHPVRAGPEKSWMRAFSTNIGSPPNPQSDSCKLAIACPFALSRGWGLSRLVFFSEMVFSARSLWRPGRNARRASRRALAVLPQRRQIGIVQGALTQMQTTFE